jgi:hypothetical protein
MAETSSATTTHPTKGTFDASRAEWRKASEDSEIEVGFVDDLIGMRHAKSPDGPVLVFTPAEWEAFLAGAKDGEFDPARLEVDPSGA